MSKIKKHTIHFPWKPMAHWQKKSEDTDYKVNLTSGITIPVQLTFTCSKSTIETAEKGVKYVQS